MVSRKGANDELKKINFQLNLVYSFSQIFEELHMSLIICSSNL